MNKAELIKGIAETAGTSQAAAGKNLDATLQVIESALSSGDTVTIVGFGTFGTSKRKSRTGRNPQTGDAIHIAERIVPVFRAGKNLKDALRRLRG
ncbi:MAG: HU family DNA-binding protein [Kaiparowitsia implicata GSE-PSE-MK54-09C]|jgi:DNA-binding protein HU-beta|nr:HU family DNA-binding protein [Kaiparowitsia implicata GSE-PSE-MK54-09C]